jgi:hypothetical protein
VRIAVHAKTDTEAIHRALQKTLDDHEIAEPSTDCSVRDAPGLSTVKVVIDTSAFHGGLLTGADRGTRAMLWTLRRAPGMLP